MAGTYSTDLTTINTADAATGWTVELAAPYGAGSTPANEPDFYIQGTACVSEAVSKTANAFNSIVYDNGTNITFTSGQVLFSWIYFTANSGINTQANGGIRVAIGTANNVHGMWYVGGNDTGRHPYGGWQNFAVDPTTTPNLATGGYTARAANRWFGAVVQPIVSIQRGQTFAHDCIRYGRGTITATGGDSTSVSIASPLTSSAANFPQMADYNDYNGGGTPSFGSAVDGGYHRFGIFQLDQGVYRWKGLISIGSAATSCYFNDGNRSIILDSTPYTLSTFNRFEIRNASTSFIVDSINITGSLLTGATPTASRGDFVVVDDATVDINGSSFVDLGTFTFLSNSTITGSTFRRCDIITSNGATLTSNLISNSISTTAYLASSAANFNNKVTAVTFNKDTGFTTPNAVDIGTINTNTTLNWDNIGTTGTNASAWIGTVGTNISSTTNGAVKVTFGSNVTLTISVTGDSDIPTVEKVGTGTVNIEANVSNTITVVDINNNPVSGAQVAVYTTTGDTELFNNQTNGSGVATFPSSQNLSIYIRVRKSTTGSTRYRPLETTGNTGATGAEFFLTLVEDTFVELVI